jgi:hypothetical protein
MQSVDLTELARQGKLDPTIGRDEGAQIVLLDYICTPAYAMMQRSEELFKVRCLTERYGLNYG